MQRLFLSWLAIMLTVCGINVGIAQPVNYVEWLTGSFPGTDWFPSYERC